MDPHKLGRNQKIQDRRLMIITLEEKGLKPREIRNSLEGMDYELKPDDVYNDLKWARENLDRSEREEIWDHQFMKEVEKELKEANHPLQKIGYRKLLLQLRQDIRKRAGLYTERIEHSGQIKQEVKVVTDEQLKDYDSTFEELAKRRTKENID